jgi:outer membrane biosynthesis protein TonB
MGRFHRHLLGLLLGLAATLALASCGEGGGAELLPGATASEISSNLKEVRRLAGEEDCIGAQDAALEVSDQIDALGGVDQKLKTALREGATRLNEVVAACEEAEPEEEEETVPSLSTEAEEVEEKDQKKPKKEEKEPPGQEKKAEKEAEKEKKEATPPEKTPTETPTTPTETPAETPGEGTTPGGIAPGTEAGAE